MYNKPTFIFTPTKNLASIIGSEPKSNQEVVKKVWEYIRKNKLQDKKDKLKINADAKLKAVCNGEEKVSMIDLARCLANNLNKFTGPIKVEKKKKTTSPKKSIPKKTKRVSKTKKEILIGYYVDGGYGAHPMVIERDLAKKINNHPDEHIEFVEKLKLDEVPEALVYYHPESGLPKFKPITNKLARKIRSMQNGQITTICDYEEDYELAEEICKLVGLKVRVSDSDTVSVIPNVKLNSCYWSKDPENHSYWGLYSGYETLKAKEFVQKLYEDEED